MNGIQLIAAERTRQIEDEGWSPEHDDAHSQNELALAAAAYAVPKTERTIPMIRDRVRHSDGRVGMGGTTLLRILWPWAESDWKPTDRIRELVKAGALIAAEIDRLQRLAADDGEGVTENETTQLQGGRFAAVHAITGKQYGFIEKPADAKGDGE